MNEPEFDLTEYYLHELIALLDSLPCWGERCLCGARHSLANCPVFNKDTRRRRPNKQKTALSSSDKLTGAVSEAASLQITNL